VNFLSNGAILDNSLRTELQSLLDSVVPPTDGLATYGNGHLGEVLESIDSRVESMWQLQSANDVITRE
jgi:hypothetical protein